MLLLFFSSGPCRADSVAGAADNSRLVQVPAGRGRQSRQVNLTASLSVAHARSCCSGPFGMQQANAPPAGYFHTTFQIEACQRCTVWVAAAPASCLFNCFFLYKAWFCCEPLLPCRPDRADRRGGDHCRECCDHHPQLEDSFQLCERVFHEHTGPGEGSGRCAVTANLPQANERGQHSIQGSPVVCVPRFWSLL